MSFILFELLGRHSKPNIAICNIELNLATFTSTPLNRYAICDKGMTQM